MKKVSIVKYYLSGVPLHKRNALHRDLYGYNDHSNNGEYTYKRNGKLDGIKYTKIGGSVIMINSADLKPIIAVLDKHKVGSTVIHLYKKP